MFSTGRLKKRRGPGRGAAEEVELIDVLAATADRPATVVVNASGKVLGLDGNTGLPLWRCDGPGRVLGVVAEGTVERPARFAFTDDSSIVLQDALPSAVDGRYDLEE